VQRYLKRHRKNVDTPYVAGGATIGLFAVISIVLFGASWFQTILLSSNNFAAVVSAVLIDLANTDRLAAGVETLAVNEKLTAAAQAKADDMALKGYFSHSSPDGRQPWDFMRAARYDYQNAGENLAIQFSDSAEVERAWLASPTHRANLLDNRFTEIGIATAYGTYQGQPTTFVVQMFAKPTNAQTLDNREAKTTPFPTVPTTPVVEEATVVVQDQPAVLGAAVEAAIAPEPTSEASWWAHLMASPQTYFNQAITLLAALILAIGAFAWWNEMRQHHYRHGIYAILLSIALIAFLYAVNAFIFTNPVITDSIMFTTS